MVLPGLSPKYFFSNPLTHSKLIWQENAIIVFRRLSIKIKRTDFYNNLFHILTPLSHYYEIFKQLLKNIDPTPSCIQKLRNFLEISINLWECFYLPLNRTPRMQTERETVVTTETECSSWCNHSIKQWNDDFLWLAQIMSTKHNGFHIAKMVAVEETFTLRWLLWNNARKRLPYSPLIALLSSQF